MRPALLLILAALLAGATLGLVQAAEPEQCLTPEQRRAAISSQKAVPLARAVRAAKARYGGELVGAHLCERGKTLVYVLTVLGRDGRVMRVTVDAASGRLVGGR